MLAGVPAASFTPAIVSSTGPSSVGSVASQVRSPSARALTSASPMVHVPSAATTAVNGLVVVVPSDAVTDTVVPGCPNPVKVALPAAVSIGLVTDTSPAG